MTTATLEETTIQHVSGEKDVAKFLRLVVRQNMAASWRDDWSAWASPETGWKLKFRRTIKGEIGQPDASVEVQTDIEITVPARDEIGEKKPFHDAKPVLMRPVHYLSIHSTGLLAMACKLILDGFRLGIEASSGSTHSSEHGLSFYSLTASKGYAMSCRIGQEAVYHNTAGCLISGCVDCGRN